MQKEDIIKKIKTSGLVAVVRGETASKAVEIAEACIEGGVAAIELTYTVPFVSKVLEKLAARYADNEIIIGAGTVLDPETARIAMLSGAQYIVSPCLNLDTIKMCNRYRVPVMPGIMTVTEAVTAMEAGADILKLFPGELFGPGFIKVLRGPLPHAQVMPTGGVDAKNAFQWIKAGAVALGAGSSLTSGGREHIIRTAEDFLSNIRAAREEII